MKCGREIAEGQVFCDRCLAVMENYPVKPGTVVQLPRHSGDEVVRKTVRKKRELSGDELIASLQMTVKRLWLCIAVLSAIVCLVTVLLINRTHQPSAPVTGRNYTVDTTHLP